MDGYLFDTAERRIHRKRPEKSTRGKEKKFIWKHIMTIELCIRASHDYSLKDE